jgi:hypothetical protein
MAKAELTWPSQPTTPVEGHERWDIDIQDIKD